MRMQKRSVSSPGIRSKIAKSPPAQHPRHLFGCVSPIAERLPRRPGNRSGRFCSQAMARAVVALRAPGKMLARASSAKSIRQFAILDAAAMQQSRSTAQAISPRAIGRCRRRSRRCLAGQPPRWREGTENTCCRNCHQTRQHATYEGGLSNVSQVRVGSRRLTTACFAYPWLESHGRVR
jgi:hypothetical protein